MACNRVFQPARPSLLRDLVASSGEFELTAREPLVLKGLDGEHVTYAVDWR